MVSKLIFLLLFAVYVQAEDVEFPKGCPTGGNFKKICSALGKIGNDKILVFADGTQLPACYTNTADESSRHEHREAQNELRSVLLKTAAMTLYGRADYLSDGQLANVQTAVSNSLDMVASPAELKDFELFVGKRDASAAIDKFVAFKEKVRPPKAYFGRRIADDARFAAKEIAKLAESLAPAGNPVREGIIRGLEETTFEELKTKKHINCRPHLNAFHSIEKPNTESTFAMSPALSQFPTSTRIQNIGHEIAHKFDPCHSPIQKGSPLVPFVECLQNQVGSFKRSLFSDFCDPHTVEAFCDAFGLHVQEAWLKAQPKQAPQWPEKKPNMIFMPPGFENIFFHLDNACSTESGNDHLSTHPDSDRRLESILLKSPTIASSLGCNVDQSVFRCDIKNGTAGTPPSTIQRLIEKVKSAIR